MLLVTALEGARSAISRAMSCAWSLRRTRGNFRDTLAKSDNVKILREVCKEITGRDLGVRFVISDGRSRAASADAPPSKEEGAARETELREQAEKDPTVQQMLRTFRGEIVDVKRVDPAK